LGWIDGEKVVALRKQRKMDQLSLAKAAGVAQSVLSRMERGMQDDYKLSVIVSVARVLGVSVDDLLTSTNNRPELEPELQAILNIIEQRDFNTQRIAARILRGLIDGLDHHDHDSNS
jgi:transcriptional regulator with XRE-family HTH domain